MINKTAGIRFDADNYIEIEYNEDAPSAKVTIVKNGEIITPSENYVTFEQLVNILSNYITETVLNDELLNYETKTELNTKLQNYVTNVVLNNTLQNYVTDAELNTTLQNYVSDSELNTALQDYVTDTELNTTLLDYSKLKWVEETYQGTFTIPSTGYLKLTSAPSAIGIRVIVSMMIASWSANSGAVTLAHASGNDIYLIGAQGASITDPAIRYLYYL